MKLLLAGDYFNNYGSNPSDLTDIFALFDNYDACIVNLEGSLIGDRAQLRKKAVRLSFSEAGLHMPKNTIACLSNNHVMDFGVGGLDATIKALNSNGINWFGIATNKITPDCFRIFNLCNKNVCFIGIGWANEQCVRPGKSSPGIVNFSKNSIDKIFSYLNQYELDFIVCYVHTGYEYEYYPLPIHVGLSRYLIDMGCDLVFQSHTHCIQPYEIYNGKHIFYGLGNFYFSSMRESYPRISDAGLLIELNVDKSSRAYSVRPINVIFNRDAGKSLFEQDSSYMKDHILEISNLHSYSRKYRSIRTRKNNPRPILYYNTNIRNQIKYIIWSLAVNVTGFLKIRNVVKRLLGWDK